MRDVPPCNPALHVQAVGVQPWEGHCLGVPVAPWCTNRVLLAGPEDNRTALAPGARELIGFPSGRYEVIHTAREQVGGDKACSPVSPMTDFNGQMQAVGVARSVMVGLFDPAVDETATPLVREAPAPQVPPPALKRARPPERRAFITGRA